jgi:hypothetical protein
MTETKSKKSKWKYWVGDLIDGREPAYDPRPLDENSCRIGPAPGARVSGSVALPSSGTRAPCYAASAIRLEQK